MHQLFAPFSPSASIFELGVTDLHTIVTFMYQFYGAQLPVFSSKFGNNCLECTLDCDQSNCALINLFFSQSLLFL